MHPQTGNRHRRMVILDNFQQTCLHRTEIAIDIAHEGVKRSFKRVGTPKRHAPSLTEFVSPYKFWAGEDSSDGSIFNFVQNDDGSMAGSMVDLTNHNVVQFHYQNDTYIATITASSDFPLEAHPAHPPKLPHSSIFTRKLHNQHGSVRNVTVPHKIQRIKTNTSTASFSLSSSSRRLYDDSGGNLDVMVLWTKAAECKAFGLETKCKVTAASRANMKALVALAIEETNAAYAASGVNTELLLVHSKRHPSYVESSLGDSLTDLYYNQVSNVHEDREAYGADIVSLMIDDSNYCGRAYIGPADYLMFSVVSWNCATGYYSFGHEIGKIGFTTVHVYVF